MLSTALIAYFHAQKKPFVAKKAIGLNSNTWMTTHSSALLKKSTNGITIGMNNDY
jgi:hypothetical protein